VPAIPWRSVATPVPDQEYLAMASRLPLKSYSRVPGFMRLALSIVRQLEGTGGLVGYSLLAQPLRRTFWTLSTWTDQQALDAFVRTMPHVAIMGKLRPHMGATRFTTWTVSGSELPISWPTAIDRLMGSDASSSRHA
jgi:quinol monooxygenase YgiN